MKNMFYINMKTPSVNSSRGTDPPQAKPLVLVAFSKLDVTREAKFLYSVVPRSNFYFRLITPGNSYFLCFFSVAPSATLAWLVATLLK
jgi:hypothetical protein